MNLMDWEGIKFSDRVMAMEGEEHVILLNVNTNHMDKITTELYHFLKEVIESKSSIHNACEACATEEDVQYFLETCEYLANNKIIRNCTDDSEYEEADMQIDVDITGRCNLKCKHCCVSADNERKDLPTDQMIQIFDKVLQVAPVRMVISGGEPLLRQDFVQLIQYLRERYHGKLALMTNATLINEELAEFISEQFDSVSVSLDGVDEETCSQIRGQGVFAKTIRGIELLKKADVKSLSLSMVLTKVTSKREEEFNQICKKYDATPVPRGLSLVGRASEYMSQMQPDPEDLSIVERPEKGKLNLHGFFNCPAAFLQFQIDYKGSIFPCQALMDEELSLGNVLEISDFRDYIRKRRFVDTEGYQLLSQFFPENQEKCGACNKWVFCFTCLEDLYRNHGKSPCTSFCDVPFEMVLV